MKSIQKDLLTAFEQSGLTYDELAKRTSLPKSALYRYLNGDTEKIPIDRFQSICSELHVDAGSVLGWKNVPDIDLNLHMFSGPDHELLSIFHSLSDEGQRYLLQQAHIASTMFAKKNSPAEDEHIG